MKELLVEWKHLDVDGKTCLRCSGTGRTLQEVIAELKKDLAPNGVRINFVETVLAETEISQSNKILFNGVALEDVLTGAKASQSCCESCSCLTGQEEVYCRTVEYEGETYEEIPEGLIYKAALKAVGIE